MAAAVLQQCQRHDSHAAGQLCLQRARWVICSGFFADSFLCSEFTIPFVFVLLSISSVDLFVLSPPPFESSGRDEVGGSVEDALAEHSDLCRRAGPADECGLVLPDQVHLGADAQRVRHGQVVRAIVSRLAHLPVRFHDFIWMIIFISLGV